MKILEKPIKTEKNPEKSPKVNIAHIYDVSSKGARGLQMLTLFLILAVKGQAI